jgi:hypothetical protein
MIVLNLAIPKWVYMLKSVEKLLCKTRKYKTVVGGAILNDSSILKFWKKATSDTNDLGENWLNYGTFMSGGRQVSDYFSKISTVLSISKMKDCIIKKK